MSLGGTDPTLWEILAAVGAFTLPFVAVWQIISLASQEKGRDRERLKAAYVALWTEWATLAALQTQWAQTDLFDMARSGALNPDELRPRDPGQFRQYLGTLGGWPAILGAQALVFVEAAAKHAQYLKWAAEADPYGVGGGVTALRAEAAKHASAVKAELERAVDVLQDALNNVPADVQQWKLPTPLIDSDVGKVIVTEFQEAENRGTVRRAKGWRVSVGARLVRWGHRLMGD